MELISGRYRPWLIYIACSLIAIAVFTSNLRGGMLANYIESGLLIMMNPFYIAVNSMLDKANHLWNRYVFLANVEEINIHLQEEIDQKNFQLNLFREKALSVKKYRNLLEFPEYPEYRYLLADIVRKGSHSWETVLIINLGEVDGLETGYGVASPDGVIGQIVSISPRMAKVLSVLHPQSGIAGKSQQTEISGVVSGQGDGTCIFKYAHRFDRVLMGERIITSGLDGMFPAGIPIGYVTRIEKNPEDIFQKVQLEPSINLLKIEHVMVFIRHSIEVFP